MDLAGLIDHTLLRPEATRAEVEAVVAEAAELGAATACISPVHLPLAPARVALCTVVGFPSGAHAGLVKAAEAQVAVAAGATEVDMVVSLGAVKEGAFDVVTAEIRAVRVAVPSPVVLKVIVESAALSDGEIVACCRCAEEGGADLVKTSTGFHPGGGATTHAVELMARTVGSRLGVKASGGIRTRAQALAMVEAGATRLGTSATRAILG